MHALTPNGCNMPEWSDVSIMAMESNQCHKCIAVLFITYQNADTHCTGWLPSTWGGYIVCTRLLENAWGGYICAYGRLQRYGSNQCHKYIAVLSIMY